MRVGYFQFDVVWGDPDRNVAIIESAVGGADTDLIVLPELCTTGYLFDSVEALNGLAEPLDGPVVTRFSELAVDNASTIVFGIAEPRRQRVVQHCGSCFARRFDGSSAQATPGPA